MIEETQLNTFLCQILCQISWSWSKLCLNLSYDIIVTLYILDITRRLFKMKSWGKFWISAGHPFYSSRHDSSGMYLLLHSPLECVLFRTNLGNLTRINETFPPTDRRRNEAEKTQDKSTGLLFAICMQCLDLVLLCTHARPICFDFEFNFTTLSYIRVFLALSCATPRNGSPPENP